MVLCCQPLSRFSTSNFVVALKTYIVTAVVAVVYLLYSIVFTFYSIGISI